MASELEGIIEAERIAAGVLQGNSEALQRWQELQQVPNSPGIATDEEMLKHAIDNHLRIADRACLDSW